MTDAPTRPQSGCTIFFTGLPAAGKSTLAGILASELTRRTGAQVTLLDGDAVRSQFSPRLGFSRADRDANIRRLCSMAAEATGRGEFAVCAAIAPYDAARKDARRIVERAGRFVLVYVSTPLEVCERRDPKGLYAKARAGEVANVTGVSDPYEPPDDAELVIDASGGTADAAARQVLAYLDREGLLPRHTAPPDRLASLG